tara:strand:+ start:3824 stop:4195 length:372 start_codon:yes stop_codon:yes gene_type:complete
MKENRIAIIKDGIIDNVIIASVEFANTLSDLTVDVTDIEVGIGWKHNLDNTFSHPDTLLSEADLLIKKTAEEKEWRDSELKASDFIIPLTDHPQHSVYIVFRQELRDYPSQLDFPNSTRPVKP